MERSIHIHEDDWGMRNLYPLGALREAAIDMEQAHEAGERHRAPNGLGWTDVYRIKEPSLNFATMALRLTHAAAAVEAFLPRVRRFVATAIEALARTALRD